MPRSSEDLVVLGSLENELAEEDFAVLQVISKVKCPVLCLPLVTNARPAELTYEVATFAGVAK
jgi:hypothetical protein